MYIVAFALGTIFGSFANAMAWRLHTGATVGGRSKCVKCKTTLGPQDLIPILSWAVLRGRCRSCQGRISWHYPAAELAGGFLFACTLWRFESIFETPLLLLFEVLFLVLILVCVCMDLRWKELPLELMVFGLGAMLIVQLAVRGVSVTELIAALFVCAVFFGSQWMLSSGRWIGSGDIFFSMFLAARLGSWELTLTGIYLTYVVGGVVAVPLLLMKRMKRGSNIPFAPFLLFGFLGALWFGEGILNAVRGIFSV